MQLIKQRLATRFTVGRRGLKVLLVLAYTGSVLPDLCGYELGWKSADALAARMRELMAGPHEQPGCIRLDLPSRTFVMPVKLASALWTALVGKAREVEEQEKAEAVAFDEAVLLRSGVPIGLSDDSKILEEAKKLAAWDPDLRRYIPSVPSSEVLGRPLVALSQVIGPYAIPSGECVKGLG